MNFYDEKDAFSCVKLIDNVISCGINGKNYRKSIFNENKHLCE